MRTASHWHPATDTFNSLQEQVGVHMAVAGKDTSREHLLALRGLGAAARGVGAGAAVGLDVSAGSLVRHDCSRGWRWVSVVSGV